MSVDMTKSYAFTFCDTDGGTTIAVEKSRYAAESFNAELETGYRSRIGLEAWGDNKVDNKVDNNAWGDIKVDNKVDNNARGDNKVDNNVGNDTVNDTVTRPENGAEPDQKTVRSPARTRPEVDNNLGDTVNGTASGPLSGLKSGSLNGPLNDVVTNLIAEISSVNRKDLVCRTGVSERTMTRNLSELERTGKIERRGSKKTGVYFLAEGSGEKWTEGQSK